jgi:putative hydrolase of the HAD superfamily
MAWRVVLIDLDDTLVADSDEAEAAMLRTAQAARPLGLEPLGLAASAIYHARERWRGAPMADECQRMGLSATDALYAEFPGDLDVLKVIRDFLPEFRAGAWADALEAAGHPDGELAHELADRFVEERRGRHDLFDDVQPTFDVLARTHRLAVVTNGAADAQREKIQLTGLDVYLDAVVISSEIGVGKPDPEPFLRALELLEVGIGEAVVVGNSPRRDVAGARAAGLHSILLDRGGAVVPERGAGPDLIIDSLVDLPDLLATAGV